MLYSCPEPEPGKIVQPYHLPGYGGHLPTVKSRAGRTYGQISREIIEDPCVAQSPIPLLAPPIVRCPPRNPCWRNPVGCEDIGCYDPVYCPPPPERPKRRPCVPINLPPCIETCDPRAHHLNRGPYVCPCKPDADSHIYRCCESMGPSYAGHIPGFTFHSTGRTNGTSTFGVKQYMQNCFYMNTFSR